MTNQITNQMPHQLNVGVIGCGYWGPNLIRNFMEIANVNLVAIADLDRAQLDRMVVHYPHISCVTQEYRNLFAMDLDAVVVATPAHTHFAIASECLAQGLHVLVEKPLTLRSTDATSLIDIAERHDRILMVGHTFEYNPAVRALKDAIQSGELGDVYYIDSVRANLGLFRTRANVLWDLAPHDISILCHILDAEPVRVSAHGSACVQSQVEDVAYVSIEFPNDVLTHIRLSWLDPLKTRRFTVVGSQKMVIYDDIEQHEKLRVFDKHVKAIRRTDTFGEFHFAYHYGNITSPYIHFEEPLRLQCQHFLQCIRTGAQPLTDGYNGRRVVQVLEAAQQSLENQGQYVPIRPSQSNATLAHRQFATEAAHPMLEVAT